MWICWNHWKRRGSCRVASGTTEYSTPRQDSGIATMDADGRGRFERGLGSVISALPADALARLTGPIGLGHVRYPTIGQGNLAIRSHSSTASLVCLWHTTAISRTFKILNESTLPLYPSQSHCDIEPVLCEFADALMECRRHEHTIDDAMTALSAVRLGSRAAVIVAVCRRKTHIVFRDPNGIRPCIIGQRDDGAFIAASESVARCPQL